jgi:hypothetical protein
MTPKFEQMGSLEGARDMAYFRVALIRMVSTSDS